jgi:hypothetical protein
MLSGIMYSILLCTSGFGTNFDRLVMPGEQSFIQTEKCQLRYDKGSIPFAEGYIEANVHLEQAEYVNDIGIKAVVEIKKCNVGNIDIVVDPKNNISLDWLKDSFIPIIRKNIQSAMQKEINTAIQYVPSFKKSCSK